MTMQVTPYLFFNGNCKEAITFYQQCLGGTLSLTTVGETTVADQMPSNQKDMIMHSNLMHEGALLLMASDNIMGDTKEGSQITLSINCNSENELNDVFSKLSAGGNAFHPVKKEFWGAMFGQCTDQFGITWMLSYDEKQAS